MFACSHRGGCMQATCGSAKPDGATDWSSCYLHFHESLSYNLIKPNLSPTSLDGLKSLRRPLWTALSVTPKLEGVLTSSNYAMRLSDEFHWH
eukprot:scaffold102190_cov21-Tisochrysis_lutea.AAC.4